MRAKQQRVLRIAYSVSDAGLRNTKYAARPSAFTLIELLIVVAIMGIVMTISVPFMNTAITGNKGINGAMRLVQEACADARALAILRHATATMTIYADGSIDVREGGTTKRNRAESLDVSGKEWRMADRPVATGKSISGGRVEMRHKYPAKIPDDVTLEPFVNGTDLIEGGEAEVKFYADGTCDEFFLKMMHFTSGENRLLWLEVTTGLSDFESDPSRFEERFRRH